MGGVKDLIEPGAIVVLFTLGSLISYNPHVASKDASRPLLGAQKSSTATDSTPNWVIRLLPDNSQFRDAWSSRFLATLPFLIEIVYWNFTYWVYQLSRAITARIIANNDAIFDSARYHALSILNLERRAHIAFEQSIQDWVLQHSSWLMNVFAVIYYSHIIVLVAFIVYLYAYARRSDFQRVRRTTAASNLVAFVILSIYRTMPPRMLPQEYGFIDVLHPDDGSGGSAWTHNKFQLTIAAMPSIHFGMSGLIGYCLVRYASHTWLRIVAPFWPLTMLATIITTANHFFLDAIVGACVPLVAWRIADMFLILRPIEEYFFLLLRTEKPEAADTDPPGLRRHERYMDGHTTLD